MAESPVLGLGVLLWEEDRASREIEMLELNADELSDPAAQLVDHLHHQLVLVVVNAVEELLKLCDHGTSYALRGPYDYYSSLS